MKVFISGIIQETNTFCPVQTDMEFFHRGYLLYDKEIKDRLYTTNSEISGFYRCCENIDDIEIVPGIAAWSVASGKITGEAFEFLLGQLLNKLEDSLPVDGVLLALHGALVSENMDDCDGYILEKVRERIGKDVPLVATLDYHANVTEKMVDEADLLVGYRTYPHKDFSETGERAAGNLIHLMRNSKKIFKYFDKLPLIVPVENTETGEGPMVEILDRICECDQDTHALSASVFCPQPWLDVYDTGVAFLLYTDNDKNLYRYMVEGVLKQIWDKRQEFFLKYPDIHNVLDNISQKPTPAIIVDSGDITSAGGIGDSTEVLRAVLDSKMDMSIVLFIVDSDTVYNAVKIGAGNSGYFYIGGGQDHGYNRKVRFFAHVDAITDENVKVKGLSFSGIKLNMGKRVLLSMNKLRIIVIEYTSLIHDPELLRSMGIVPEEQDIIIQKSHKLFREAYKEIAKTIAIADTPGFTDQNIKRLGFKYVRRPVYPLDAV